MRFFIGFSEIFLWGYGRFHRFFNGFRDVYGRFSVFSFQGVSSGFMRGSMVFRRFSMGFLWVYGCL